MDEFITWLKMQLESSTFSLRPPKNIEFIDIVQILIIAYFVYHLILWVKHTRAYLLLKGVILICVFVLAAGVFHMDVIMEIFKMVSVAALTAVVIIFQPELRRVLEQLGDRNFFDSLVSLGTTNVEDNLRFDDQTLNELVRASFEMGEVKTGALIVIEQNISLSDYDIFSFFTHFSFVKRKKAKDEPCKTPEKRRPVPYSKRFSTHPPLL